MLLFTVEAVHRYYESWMTNLLQDRQGDGAKKNMQCLKKTPSWTPAQFWILRTPGIVIRTVNCISLFAQNGSLDDLETTENSQSHTSLKLRLNMNEYWNEYH